MFPDLGEVTLCRRCPVGPSGTFPSDRQSYMLWGAPMWVAWVLLVVGVAPSLVGCYALPHEVAAGLLVGRFRPRNGQLWDPWGSELVLACWWAGKSLVLKGWNEAPKWCFTAPMSLW